MGEMIDSPRKCRIPWWGKLGIAGVLLIIFGWMTWVKLSEIAVLSTKLGVPPKYSLQLLKWLGPRAGKEIFETETFFKDVGLGMQWHEIVASMMFQAEQNQSQREKLICSLGNIKNSKIPYLEWAIGTNSSNVCKALIKAGADINQVNDFYTPLMACAFWGMDDLTVTFIDAGADVNMKNNDGMTALHVAIGGGINLIYYSEERFMVVGILIRHGADINCRDKNGETPLDYVQSGAKNRKQMYDLLRVHGAKTGAELDAEKERKTAPDSEKQNEPDSQGTGRGGPDSTGDFGGGSSSNFFKSDLAKTQHGVMSFSPNSAGYHAPPVSGFFSTWMSCAGM